jgi:hypothetical protein
VLLGTELEIKTVLETQVTPDTFFTFNNGNVLALIGSIQGYTALITTPKPGKVLNHTLVLDPIALYIKKRILVINTVTKQVEAYGENHYNYNIVLLYNPVKSAYEGVTDHSRISAFSNTDKLVKTLTALIKAKKGEITPEYIYSELKSKKSKGISQNLDHLNKVKYISCSEGIIPVSPASYGGLLGVPVARELNRVPLEKQVKLLEKISTSVPGLTPNRVIVRPTTDTVIGVNTQAGLMVPVLAEKMKSKSKSKSKKGSVSVPHMYYNLVPDIQASIHNNKTVDNASTEFIVKQKFVQELYQRLRLHVSKVLDETQVTAIQNVLKSKVSLEKRLGSLVTLIRHVVNQGNLVQMVPGYPKNIPRELPVSRTILDHFCNERGQLKIARADLNLFVSRIATELLNSNYKVLSKTGVSMDIEDENHYIIRESETILTNSKDIKSKVNKFKV